ncbi:MAG: hypothetical protein CBB87_02185 [Micavibrio sp. TMED27]|nr:hypothetical protein [Micavibrio sp.]OUT92571.1 MAG: hypothetical protein CBB87_02185 [Micavibrio sp. TMED27]
MGDSCLMSDQNCSVVIFCNDEVARQAVEQALSLCAYEDKSWPSYRVCKLEQDSYVQAIEAGDEVILIHADEPDGYEHAYLLRMPLRLGALKDRLQYIMRRDTLLSAEAPFSFGPYVVMPSSRTISVAKGTGKSDVQDLTVKECEILMILRKANGEVVSKADLLEKVWGFAKGVDTHTVETHIYRLRRKVEVDPAQPEHILTLDNGYCLKG